MSLDYKNAGVDVEAGYKSVELIKRHVKNTFRSEVLTDLGGFGALFSISKAKEMEDPVLVSGTDGVGTKLKIAFLLDRHETVGIDCVAMCVNDIICSGAEPLFFLDYIACGKNQPEKIAKIVEGVAEGCKMANVSLIGGETAEMPGFYPENEYDLAGFSVGLLDNAKAINSSKVRKGDVIVGIASSGLHSNGFSLVRKLLRPSENNVTEFVQSLSTTLGDELIKPTKIYVRPVLELIKKIDVKGIANITGGGFIENIPRIMPKGLRPKINLGSWEIYPIFKLLKQVGELSDESMFNVFNMGIGMVLVVDKNDADRTVSELNGLGERAYIIGEIAEGEGIEIC